MIKSTYRSLCKVTLFYCAILIKFELFQQAVERLQILIFMKILPVTAELLHADRRTDRRTDTHNAKKIVAFRNSDNAPKNSPSINMFYI